MNVNEINVAILGLNDSELKQVQEAVQMRKSTLKSQLLRTLRPGDRVRIDNISPKAICGLEGVVDKVNRTTVSVTLGSEAGRYAGKSHVPVSCCELV